MQVDTLNGETGTRGHMSLATDEAEAGIEPEAGTEETTERSAVDGKAEKPKPPSKRNTPCSYPGCKFNGVNLKRHMRRVHPEKPTHIRDSGFESNGRFHHWIAPPQPQLEVTLGPRGYDVRHKAIQSNQSEVPGAQEDGHVIEADPGSQAQGNADEPMEVLHEQPSEPAPSATIDELRTVIASHEKRMTEILLALDKKITSLEKKGNANMPKLDIIMQLMGRNTVTDASGAVFCRPVSLEGPKSAGDRILLPRHAPVVPALLQRPAACSAPEAGNTERAGTQIFKVKTIIRPGVYPGVSRGGAKRKRSEGQKATGKRYPLYPVVLNGSGAPGTPQTSHSVATASSTETTPKEEPVTRPGRVVYVCRPAGPGDEVGDSVRTSRAQPGLSGQPTGSWSTTAAAAALTGQTQHARSGTQHPHGTERKDNTSTSSTTSAHNGERSANAGGPVAHHHKRCTEQTQTSEREAEKPRAESQAAEPDPPPPPGRRTTEDRLAALEDKTDRILDLLQQSLLTGRPSEADTHLQQRVQAVELKTDRVLGLLRRRGGVAAPNDTTKACQWCAFRGVRSIETLQEAAGDHLAAYREHNGLLCDACVAPEDVVPGGLFSGHGAFRYNFSLGSSFAPTELLPKSFVRLKSSIRAHFTSEAHLEQVALHKERVEAGGGRRGDMARLAVRGLDVALRLLQSNVPVTAEQLTVLLTIRDAAESALNSTSRASASTENARPEASAAQHSPGPSPTPQNDGPATGGCEGRPGSPSPAGSHDPANSDPAGPCRPPSRQQPGVLGDNGLENPPSQPLRQENTIVPEIRNADVSPSQPLRRETSSPAASTPGTSSRQSAPQMLAPHQHSDILAACPAKADPLAYTDCVKYEPWEDTEAAATHTTRAAPEPAESGHWVLDTTTPTAFISPDVIKPDRWEDTADLTMADIPSLKTDLPSPVRAGGSDAAATCPRRLARFQSI